MGIVKFQPALLTHMAGQVSSLWRMVETQFSTESPSLPAGTLKSHLFCPASIFIDLLITNLGNRTVSVHTQTSDLSIKPTPYNLPGRMVFKHVVSTSVLFDWLLSLPCIESCGTMRTNQQCGKEYRSVPGWYLCSVCVIYSSRVLSSFGRYTTAKQLSMLFWEDTVASWLQ